MEEKTWLFAHGRTNSRERWSSPRFPDARPLTARLDSLTASSRSHPSQSLHMTERIFTHGLTESGSLHVLQVSSGSPVSRPICSQDPRVPLSQQVPLFDAPCFPSVVVEWEGDRQRGINGRKYSTVRGRDRGIVRVMWECCSS
jgi:hypothetical protein